VFETERILRYQEPTPLPEAPGFLEGMMTYGDGAIPVIDLRKRLGTAAPIDDDTRVAVLHLERVRLLFEDLDTKKDIIQLLGLAEPLDRDLHELPSTHAIGNSTKPDPFAGSYPRHP